MVTATFDLGGLYQAVDVERRRQGLSWAALAQRVGVAVSTIRRFGVANDAEADGVLALIRWLGVAPEDFVTGSKVKGQHLPSGGAGYVRVDMDAIAAAAGNAVGANTRTRTTIQKLVRVAQQARRPVSLLTRLSDG